MNKKAKKSFLFCLRKMARVMRGGGGAVVCLFMLFAAHLSFAEGIYTGLINLLPDGFPLPAVSIINMIYGSYGSVELGGVNIVEGSLYGVQSGLINITGESMEGAQIGIFFNLNSQDMRGTQIGGININAGDTNGLQAGFYNKSYGVFSGIQAGGFNYIVGDYAEGLQFGLTNADAGVFTGVQFGILNSLGSGLVGAQIGAVNYTGGLAEGIQIGGINVINGGLSGIQLGLFNYVESVDSGAPIGVLSIVRDYGYFALEASYSNLNADIRIISGLEYLYSSLSLAVSMSEFSIFSTFGLGSTIYMFSDFWGDYICFVPEIRFTTPLVLPLSIIYPETSEPVLNLLKAGIFPFSFTAAAKLGFNFGERFLISAGPVFGIDHDSQYIYPNFPFAAADIGGDFRFIFGFEASFRWILSD
jgi:hypothetical protein